MKKIKSQQSKPFKETRKGVKPNHRRGKLINIENGREVKRVHEILARTYVQGGEWRYCPKKFTVQS